MAKSTKANTLVTLGTLESGKPYTVDLINNPVVTIVGGTGTGKTRLTTTLVNELVETNTPEELKVIILDAKESLIWKVLAKESHCIGHHKDIQDYTSVLIDVKTEHERRAKEIARQGVSTWEEVEGVNNPQLVVVIDELTQTMETLRNTDEKEYVRFRNTLENLATVVRATGIRIIVVGQRDGDASIPKGYLANTSLKVGMKSNVKTDKLFGDVNNLSGLRVPTSPGEAIVTSRECPNPEFIKAPY